MIDYILFYLNLKSMEAIFINLINASIEPIKEIGDAVTLIKAFSSLAWRNSIVRCVSKNENFVTHLFIQECNTIRKDFDANRRKPPLRKFEPAHAGAALWAKSLLTSIKWKWNQLCIMSDSHEIEDNEVKSEFAKIVSTLEAYQRQRHRDWIDSLLTEDVSKLPQRFDQVRLYFICIISF